MFEHFEEFNGQSEINHEVEYAKFVLNIDKPNSELMSFLRLIDHPFSG